jgi:hypothetical protein
MNSTSDHQKQQFLNSSALEVVVELQKAELDRLLVENKRLHQRIDQLLQLQEREQVLRQQLQSVLGNPTKTTQLPNTLSYGSEVQSLQTRYGRLKDALGVLLVALEKRSRG